MIFVMLVLVIVFLFYVLNVVVVVVFLGVFFFGVLGCLENLVMVDILLWKCFLKGFWNVFMICKSLLVEKLVGDWRLERYFLNLVRLVRKDFVEG